LRGREVEVGRPKRKSVTGRPRRAAGDGAPDLRQQLEQARLDLRALYRSADQLGIAQHLPPEVQALLELDADFAEALWVLDQPPGRFDLAHMRRDTLASLARLPRAREQYLASLPPDERQRLLERAAVIRSDLTAEDAYLEIPGRDPAVG
jgi:hypothetical protein